MGASITHHAALAINSPRNLGTLGVSAISFDLPLSFPRGKDRECLYKE